MRTYLGYKNKVRRTLTSHYMDVNGQLLAVIVSCLGNETQVSKEMVESCTQEVVWT